MHLIFKIVSKCFFVEFSAKIEKEQFKQNFLEQILVFFSLVAELMTIENVTPLIYEIQILLIEVCSRKTSSFCFIYNRI